MGVVLPIHVLRDVSRVLIEDLVSTLLNTGVGAPNINANAFATVTPGSMLGIYAGAQLIAGSPGNQEVIGVASATATTFTAWFTKAHLANEFLMGATFPSGQPDHPTWTQRQMLNYLSESQNEFLLKVRPVYAIGTQALTVGARIYPLPDDSIRAERISVNAVELWDSSTNDLDWMDSNWQNESSPSNPRYFYQDKVGVQKFGVGPPPQVGSIARIFYSQRASNAVQYLDPFLVLDCMTYILKYGVLAQAFGTDGEQRDPVRAAYCRKRFDLGCLISSKFMQGIAGRFKNETDTVEPMLAAMGK